MGAALSRPQDEKEFINVSLPKDDFQRLSKLLETLRRIDGWCSINRAIGKFIIFGAIAVLVVLSQGFDAVRNLLSGFGKH